MDSQIAAAARALAQGHPLVALNHVALRGDAPALALRGIAMARIGDLPRARALLAQAGRAFGPREPVARARCSVALAEIALVLRDLHGVDQALARARAVLHTRGDRTNTAYATYLLARLSLLTGQVERAESVLAMLDAGSLAPPLAAACGLLDAGIRIRRVDAHGARAALARAGYIAGELRMPGLTAEIRGAAAVLDKPAARLVEAGQARAVLLDELQALFGSGALVVDACRYAVRCAAVALPLQTRPVLLALARMLAEAWPDDVPRTDLLARVFRARDPDETHRARLRVEIGRLREKLRPLADIVATERGFLLRPAHGGAARVCVVVPPADIPHPAVLALLADGQAWSSASLAATLGASQRTLQRWLDDLAGQGAVQPVGQGRGRRWTLPPVAGYPTDLLLTMQWAHP